MEITVDDNTPISALVSADTPVAEVAASLNNETPTNDDEDYAWLTERLDATVNELRETRTAMLEAITMVREQSQNQSNELREANRLLMELTQTLANQFSTQMTEQLTLLRSIQPTLVITSKEPNPNREPEINPVNVVVENPVVEPVPVRKRRIL